MSESLTPLKSRIEAALVSHTGGEALVKALQPLAGGAMQENYRVDVVLSKGELPGVRRLVIRTDAKTKVALSLSRREEFAVIGAAVAAGVKTPNARWLTPGLVRDGADAYFLDWADGEAIGRRVVRNPELEAARSLLPAQLGQALARIHSITPATAPALTFGGWEPPGNSTPAVAELATMRRLVDTLPERDPAIELIVRWLSDHAPQGREVTLTHSDFRTGNFLVTPAGLSAVLDWEFAHWSAPAADVAWISVRDWRFGRLDKPVGGFARREPFYEAYEKASGRRLDLAEVHWWEVAGNLRWAIGSYLQGERYASGEETDLELVAIPTRAVEMEYEALRLIERGRF